MKIKKAKELEPGDMLVNGELHLTVKNVGRGFWPGSVLIDWKENVEPRWSCVDGTEELRVC